MSEILLGILGGGQLGSMLSVAAKKLNIKTIIYSDDKNAPAQKFADEFIYGKYLASDIYNKETGEIFAEAGNEIDEKLLDILRQNEVSNFLVLITSNKSGAYIRNTIFAEKDIKRSEALAAIYKIMRPGEPPTEESSEKLFYDLFLLELSLL